MTKVKEEAMTREELIELLISDTMNEYHHMLFYLNASSFLRGPFREEIGEFFLKEAADEMGHVNAFTNLVIELGGRDRLIERLAEIELKVQTPVWSNIDSLLRHVLAMEEEVVANYTQRMEDAMDFGGVDGRYVEIFLEDQILDSKKTAAHVRQMLDRGN